MRQFTKYPQGYVKASTTDNLSIDDMRDFINAEWENCGCGEKMSRSEAETYLGHSVKDMSWSEIDEEVSAIQKAYYTDGDPMGATDQEIIDKYNEMIGSKGYVKASSDIGTWVIEPNDDGTYTAHMDLGSKDGLMRFTREVYVDFQIIDGNIQYLDAYQVGAGGISDFTSEAEFSGYYPNALQEIARQV